MDRAAKIHHHSDSESDSKSTKTYLTWTDAFGRSLRLNSHQTFLETVVEETLARIKTTKRDRKDRVEIVCQVRLEKPQQVVESIGSRRGGSTSLPGFKGQHSFVTGSTALDVDDDLARALALSAETAAEENARRSAQGTKAFEAVRQASLTATGNVTGGPIIPSLPTSFPTLTTNTEPATSISASGRGLTGLQSTSKLPRAVPVPSSKVSTNSTGYQPEYCIPAPSTGEATSTLPAGEVLSGVQGIMFNFVSDFNQHMADNFGDQAHRFDFKVADSEETGRTRSEGAVAEAQAANLQAAKEGLEAHLGVFCDHCM